MNILQTSPETDFPGVSPHEANARKTTALFLDVRTPAEFEEAHIEGSVLHPLNNLAPGEIEKLASGKNNCVIICQSGSRARLAAAKLKASKLPGPCILDGGVQAWIDAQLPVIRGERKVLPLMRQVQITIGFVSAVGAALALVVDPRFAIIPLFTGCGLLFAGLSGFCGLALLLARMPWNQASSCNSGSCCETKK
jgi:rhodanese-related sulfurtransferase